VAHSTQRRSQGEGVVDRRLASLRLRHRGNSSAMRAVSSRWIRRVSGTASKALINSLDTSSSDDMLSFCSWVIMHVRLSLLKYCQVQMNAIVDIYLRNKSNRKQQQNRPGRAPAPRRSQAKQVVAAVSIFRGDFQNSTLK
jgi:hypothetical protein